MSFTRKIRVKDRQLHKFGGSSLIDAKSYLRVVGIVAEYSMPGDVIVVSAAGNTTNYLIRWLKLKQFDRSSANQIEQSLRLYQSRLISDLLLEKEADILISSLVQDLEKLARLLDSVITDAVYAEVVGHGEIWSARLMSAVLEQNGLEAIWKDARDFLRAEYAVQPQVDAKLSYPLLQQLLAQYPGKRIVVTGFISRNQAGETVLLGRNGSDYSATQIGALASVSRVTIWSDVAGVYSADPHKVKDAYLLPLLHLNEASELARLSTSVLHTRTLQPIFDSNIDLQLRCIYTPDQGSTRIERLITPGTGVCIVTSHDDVCLIELKTYCRYNFELMQKNINALLKREEISPLAVGMRKNHKLLQLCYTTEVAERVLKILNEEVALQGELRLRHGLALIAIVGEGIANNSLYRCCFCQQIKNYPVEFTWKSEDGISLVAVLRISSTDNLIQKLHTSISHIEKFIISKFCLTNMASFCTSLEQLICGNSMLLSVH